MLKPNVGPLCRKDTFNYIIPAAVIDTQTCNLAGRTQGRFHLDIFIFLNSSHPWISLKTVQILGLAEFAR